MIRTLLRPATFSRSLPRALPAGRSVTTRAPTTSSGAPTTEISGTLAPGEEIDPQRKSYSKHPRMSDFRLGVSVSSVEHWERAITAGD
jgi:hypothetical protein